ncbi:MAG: hypothetical protein WCD11_02685 [Solirubrobacteraceae bacterium]
MRSRQADTGPTNAHFAHPASDVHEQDVWADWVAADFDVLGESGEDPYAPAAVEAAGGLEVHVGCGRDEVPYKQTCALG